MKKKTLRKAVKQRIRERAGVRDGYGCIYELRDGDEPFYVGATTKIAFQRLRDHITNARKGRRSPYYDHIRTMLDAGREPTIHVLERDVEIAFLRAKETQAIRDKWLAGVNILNVIDAGWGCNRKILANAYTRDKFLFRKV